MRDLLDAYLFLGLRFMVSLFNCLLQVFTGNDDSDTVVYNALSPPVTTMFVRVLPMAWNSRISMRIELYGCPGNLSKLRRSGCYKWAISTYLILKRFLLVRMVMFVFQNNQTAAILLSMLVFWVLNFSVNPFFNKYPKRPQASQAHVTIVSCK